MKWCEWIGRPVQLRWTGGQSPGVTSVAGLEAPKYLPVQGCNRLVRRKASNQSRHLRTRKACHAQMCGISRMDVLMGGDRVLHRRCQLAMQ